MLCIVLCARLPGVAAVFMHNMSMSVLIFIKYDIAAFFCCVFLSAVSVPFSLQIILLHVQSNLL